MNHHMKEPCQHCPFLRTVKPFLHPNRGVELAFHATNPYNTFPCHKTTVPDNESYEMHVTEKSLECAGFIALKINEGMKCPEEFTPSKDVYSDIQEMIEAYDAEWYDKHETK